MDFSLKPHPLVGHWVPGFVLLTIVLFSVFEWNYSALTTTLASTSQIATFTVLGWVVAAFVLGETVDSLRDLIERLFGCCGWELFSDQFEKFLIEGKPDQIDRFEEYYFTYYVAGFNLALSLLLAALSRFILPYVGLSLILPPAAWLVMIIAFLILLLDAVLLRNEMIGFIKKTERR